VIQGRVIDETTQRPLEAVQISVVGTQRGTLTGSDGTYRIEGVTPGQHQVRAEYIGYQSNTVTVTVTAGQPVTADFTLTQSVLDLEEIVVTGVAGQQVRAKLPFSVDRLTTASMPVTATTAPTMYQGQSACPKISLSRARPCHYSSPR